MTDIPMLYDPGFAVESKGLHSSAWRVGQPGDAFQNRRYGCRPHTFDFVANVFDGC